MNNCMINEYSFQRGRKLLKQKQAAQGPKETMMEEDPSEEPPHISLVRNEPSPIENLTEGKF